jgi:hypothetical protein
MSNSFFKKYPKIATAVLSSFIVAIAVLIITFVIRIDFLQDYKGGEKYSIADEIIYAIRCNGNRNISLRELKPNYDYVRIPAQKYETLEYKEYNLRTDKDAIIKPSFIHKNPDLQIFFIGGSTTECETVDEKFRFAYLVGRNLEKELKININSDNASKSGNNSLHSINILVNKLLPYKPDIVVMMHNINDLSTLFYEGTYWNNNKTIAPISCALKNKTDLRKSDEWSNSKWQHKILNNKKEQEKLVKQYRQNLKLFINISRAKNIMPVLMTQANRIENDPNFKTSRGGEIDKVYKKLYVEFNQTIREVGKQEGILVIDLAKKIPADKKYIYDVVHLNKAGSIMAANIISNEIKNYLKK